MIDYIVRRLLFSIPLLLLISLVFFFLAQALPGDAVLAAVSSEAGGLNPEALARRRAALGLDRPWPYQYAKWLGHLLHGNFGTSYLFNQPISRLLLLRLPATLELMGIALVASIVLGTIIGVLSARYQYSVLDYVVTILGFAGVSVPVFFLGLLFMYVFALKLGWFPTSGRVSLFAGGDLVESLRHLFLPVLTLTVLRTAVFARYVRSSMLDVITQDYILVARAKGVRARRLIWRHALRNALIPLVTVVGLNVPVLLAGAVFIETIYQWPGMGLLFINAVMQRDSPLIVAIGMLIACGVVLANLLTDVTYSGVDPRIRLG